MSAYSDWKVGAISDDEYKAAMRRECEDHYPDMERMPKQCMDCMWRSDAKIRERKGRILKAEYSGEKEDKVLIYPNPDKDGFVVIEMCTNDDSDKYMTEIDGSDEECRYFEEENC